MIFGRPGSGKSTFALKIHKKTDIPLYHLDCYFYLGNWQERDYQEFLDIQKKIVDKEQWIIDGNCTKSLEMRYQRADLCLYFNYPRWRCYLRIIKRLFVKDHKIKDRAQGCSETIRWSLLYYIWTFEKRVFNQTKTLKAKYPGVQFIEIQNDNDLNNVEMQL